MKNIAVLGLALFAVVEFCHGEVDWPQLKLTCVATNLYVPVHIAHAGDGSGRLFIVQQDGIVRTLTGTNLDEKPFLDVSTKILTGWERGLLSIAFPPGFATNRSFYAFYTRKADGAVTVSRFSMLPGQELVDTNSEQVLLTVPHPGEVHNGGQMAFGPDGYLYIGIGDGGGGGPITSNPAQRLDSMLGKILRIDPQNGSPYAIPGNNPFVNTTNARPEIWAYGLRNPWRFSFDRQTGDLYLPDVGSYMREEINFQEVNDAGGQNYGWPKMEGFTQFSPDFPGLATNTLCFPVVDYSGPYQACIIGGYVCRKANLGRVSGIYLFGDFVLRRIFGLKLDDGEWKRVELGDVSGPSIAPSTFGEDESGQLYVADYYNGAIYAIEDNGAAARPTFSPASGNTPTEFITLNSLSTNSAIRYTFEDRNPTDTDPLLVSGTAIVVTNGATVRAQAFRADLTPSLVSTGMFTFVAGTPEFTPAEGPVTNKTTLAMTTATPGAEIRYTTNGTFPTTNSSVYSGPITINGNTVVYARAYRSNFVQSSLQAVNYEWKQVDTPTFSPASGPITNGTFVSISCSLPGAKIHYTTNGTDPHWTSTRYTAPFSIQGNTIVKAIAYLTNHAPSVIQTVLFDRVRVAMPTFSPNAGLVAYNTLVQVSVATAGAKIYYTLNGSTPTANATLYTGPIAVKSNLTLRAIGWKSGYDASFVRSEMFYLPTVEAPSFSPASGPITNGTSITITAPTPGSKIFYTLDGSTPTTSSLLYTNAISIAGNRTLTAKAFKAGYNPSSTNGTFYHLIARRKTVVTTIAGNGSPGFKDEPGILSQFYMPSGLCLSRDGKKLYVADTQNHRIRMISLTNGYTTTTFVGSGSPGNFDASGTNAQFHTPTSICVASDGNFYIPSRDNRVNIRKVTPAGVVTTKATTNSSPRSLWQIDADAVGNLYYGDSKAVWKVDSSGKIMQLAGACCSFTWGETIGLCLDPAGNIFASSTFKVKPRIIKITPNGAEETYAGWGLGLGDGPRLQAGFGDPRDTAIDSSGNLYVAESTRIRVINTNGFVSTLAGAETSGYKNGPGYLARFSGAAGIAVDVLQNVYVADVENHCIRRISFDNDSDGIPDFEEASGGFLPGVDDTTVDSDGDGRSNADEYLAGTNPQSAASRFTFAGVTRTNDTLAVSWNATANRLYTISSSTNLVSWNVITNVPIGATGSASVTLTNATGGRVFFRLSVALP